MVTLRKSPSGPAAFLDGALSVGGTVRVEDDGDLEGVPGTLPSQLWFWNGTMWLPTSTSATDGQSPVWNAAANDWLYRTPTSTSELQYFDTTHSPLFLYNCNNTLADQSGNGFNLTSLLPEAYAPVYPGKIGFFQAGGGTAVRNTPTPALSIQGDLTLQIILQLDDNVSSATTPLFTYTSSGETEANNVQYQFNLNTMSGTSLPRRLSFLSESGAGVDATFTSTGTSSIGLIHNLMYLACRRQNGVITFFYQGEQFGASSGVLTTPTGGSSNFFYLFSNVTVGSNVPGIVFSAKGIAGALSNADIRAEYNRTMGPAFGRIAA